MDVDVLDRDFLLALAAMPVEGFDQLRISARQLGGLAQPSGSIEGQMACRFTGLVIAKSKSSVQI